MSGIQFWITLNLWIPILHNIFIFNLQKNARLEFSQLHAAAVGAYLALGTYHAFKLC